MSARRAEFVVEANPIVGGGHLARCATLAEKLTALGWQTILRTGDDPAIILPRAVGMFTDWRKGSDPDEPCDLAIFDGYDIDEKTERAWRRVARRHIVIDDLANRAHDADLLFDATPGREASDYSQLVSAHAQVLTGAKYAILRRSWLEMSSRRNDVVPNKVRNVIVAMGATDPRDITSHILTAALAAVPHAKILAILGKGAPHLARLRSQFSDLVDILVDPDDYDERIAMADMVIGAAGSSALERACVGVPSITCVTATNQVNMAIGLSQLGMTKVLEEREWRDETTLVQSISGLDGDLKRRQEFSMCGREIVDGRGALRVAVAAVGLCQSGISLRMFERSDSDWLFGLQCLPETRRFARNPNIPTQTEHRAYTESILTSDRRLLLIVERADCALGYVRLDLGFEDGAQVSIAVHPRWQRQRVGSAALELLRGLAPGLRLKAFIKRENFASASLFEAVGYFASKQCDGGVWLESDSNDRL